MFHRSLQLSKNLATDYVSIFRQLQVAMTPSSFKRKEWKIMRKKVAILKSGMITPDSGPYAVVGPRGGKLGIEIFSIQGKPLPPTPKPRQSYVPVNPTEHKK